MFPLAGGIFMGWALGANDASNVFGTAVASRIITFRKAAILCSLFVCLGAIFQGTNTIHTVRTLSEQNNLTLQITSIAAAITVLFMIFSGLPISATQAMVGAIIGTGCATGSVDWVGFQKILVCWAVTPVAGIIISIVVQKLLNYLIRYIPMSILTRDKLLWGGLLIVGSYGSYVIGANNIAITIGIYSDNLLGFSDYDLVLTGSAAIALGVIMYGKKMMFALGKGIMILDAMSALSAVTAMAVTVHLFTFLGIPVSARQAIVGAIIGISLFRDIHAIHLKNLINVSFGWIVTPLMSLILAAAGCAIFCR
jgi:PiT family inorganic phosphate transporter